MLDQGGGLGSEGFHGRVWEGLSLVPGVGYLCCIVHREYLVLHCDHPTHMYAPKGQCEGWRLVCRGLHEVL